MTSIKMVYYELALFVYGVNPPLLPVITAINKSVRLASLFPGPTLSIVL